MKEPKGLKTLYAKYTIVTPMFIGGATQTPDDGIRPPAVKGALRFWWRALNGQRFQQANPNNTQTALQQLHQEEARIFGTTVSNDKRYQGGQGCFLLAIKQHTAQPTCADWPPNDPNHGASYMAYGLLKTNDEPHRIALKEGITFTVQLVFKPHTAPTDYSQIQAALEAWSLLGGLGGRSRRAMGSISLTEINGETRAYDKAEYEAALQQLFRPFTATPLASLAPYTAFSQQSRYCIINTAKNARQLVEKMGERYKAFRNEKTLRGKRKVPFGLPLADVDSDNRRSSPLFFHVHQLRNTCVGTLIYLPAAIFHPNEAYQNLSMQVVEDFLGVCN